MVALFFEGLKWYFYFSSNRARWVSLGYFFYWTERLTSFWETLYQSSGRSCSYRELLTLCRWEASVHSTASGLFQSRSCVVGRIIGRMPGTLLWLLSGIKSLTFFFKLPSCSHRADFWKKKNIFFFLKLRLKQYTSMVLRCCSECPVAKVWTPSVKKKKKTFFHQGIIWVPILHNRREVGLSL